MTTPKVNLLEEARSFAINAHNSINHKRKYTDEPYYKHCERVVKILSEITEDQEVLAAAWMHDVLEDVAPHNQEYSEEKIRELFGNRVCDMVIELTDTLLEYGNRATRKARDRARLEAASPEVKSIKLADLIDNYIDIQKNDPGFLIILTKEVALLLPCLCKGDNILYLRLSKLLAKKANGNEILF